MRTTWLVGATVLLVTACGGPTEEGPTQDPAAQAEDATTDEEPSAPQGSGDTASALGSGQVILGSDTPDIAAIPAAEGVVLVVPDDDLPEFWRQLTGSTDGPADPSTIRAAVSPEEVPQATVSSIRTDGTFDLPTNGGDSLLCVADTMAGDDPGPPHQLWGCVEVTGEELAGDLRIVVDRAVYLE